MSAVETPQSIPAPITASETDVPLLCLLAALALLMLGLAAVSARWPLMLAPALAAAAVAALHSHRFPGSRRSRTGVAVALALLTAALPAQAGIGLLAAVGVIALLARYRDWLPVSVAASVVLLVQLRSADTTAGPAVPVLAVVLTASAALLIGSSGRGRRPRRQPVRPAITATLETAAAAPAPAATSNTDHLSVHEALSALRTGMMIADREHHIVYANQAVIEILRGHRQELLKAFGDFDPDRLIGTSIHRFHRDPARIRALLDGLDGSHASRIQIGQACFGLNVTPMIDAGQQRHGFVVEWHDRSGETRMEQDIASIIDAAACGRLDQRLQIGDPREPMERLAAGVNRLLDATCASADEMRLLLSALSRGDLSRRISRDFQGVFGQMKSDANATAAQLAAIVADIQHSAARIEDSAIAIATGNDRLSARTEHQAATLEEAAAAMEQLSRTLRDTAGSAQQARALTEGAATIARHGGSVVEEVVDTMQAIEQASKKIAEIIAVIDGITFQTNILALNAAVEAARAGDSGRGFAVVAAEVRLLAQRSATAAREIKQLIGDSVDKVALGAALVGKARTTMNEIVDSVQRVSVLNVDIAEASREQQRDIEQLHQTIAQMDRSTQQNAALVQDTSQATHDMKQQAGGLARTAARFQLEATAPAIVPVAASRTHQRQPAPC